MDGLQRTHVSQGLRRKTAGPREMWGNGKRTGVPWWVHRWPVEVADERFLGRWSHDEVWGSGRWFESGIVVCRADGCQLGVRGLNVPRASSGGAVIYQVPRGQRDEDVDVQIWVGAIRVFLKLGFRRWGARDPYTVGSRTGMRSDLRHMRDARRWGGGDVRALEPG